MSELKPCHYCGSEDVDIVGVEYDRRFFCVCGKCGYKSHEEYNEAEAIEAWNRRANENN